MPAPGPLRTMLAGPAYQRLLGVRFAGQFGDGVFQASLAGAVLFNPDHQAHAADVASGFAVLLLPYSFIGPFAGVLIDRWSRQRVLTVANLIRGVLVIGVGAEIAAGVAGETFYISALVVISVNRFVLAALSAALPHVVTDAELVTANAFSTTLGALCTTAGAGGAIALRAAFGSGDGGYAAMAAAATVPYLLASGFGSRFGVDALGPDENERAARQTARQTATELLGGARHVLARRRAATALAMIGLQRFGFGIASVCTLLLYRNYFHSHGVFRAGLGGLGQVVAGVAIGSGIAALLTPAAVRRWGYIRWPVAMLVLASFTEITFALPYTLASTLVAAVLLGLSAQGVKICVDTTVQREVDDDFRGRVFSLYDALFNVMFVAAAVLTALALPDSGYSPGSVIALSVGYLVVALGYLRLAG